MADEQGTNTERAAAALVDPGAPPPPPEGSPDQEAEFVAALRAAGVTKEGLPAAMNYLRMLQTPDGQAAIVEQYLASDRGKAARERFAMDEMARLAATKPQAFVDIGLKNGAKMPGVDEEDLPVEDRVAKTLEAMEARFSAKLAALEQGHRQTAETVSGALSQAQRQQEFMSWAGGLRDSSLKTDQFRAIHTRAEELTRLYPERYQGAGSFGRAAQDAYAGLQSASSVFAPPRGPRSLRSTGGGVAGKPEPAAPDFEANPNLSDRELKALLGKQIGLAAEDFAAAWTGREEL